MLAAQVGGQHGQALERLHPLQEVGGLHVGVAVLGVPDVGPLAEEGVGLVEEQDAVHPLGLGEDPVEVLLGLAHVLVDDRRQVDHVQVEPERAGQHLGRHRLAGARLAGEEGLDASAPGSAVGQAPLVEHPFPPPHPGRQLLELDEHLAGQHQVDPCRGWLDPPGQALQPGGVLAADAGQQVGLGHRPAVGPGPDGGRPGGTVEVFGRQPELGRPLDAVGPAPFPVVSNARARMRLRSPGVGTGASSTRGTSRLHDGSHVRLPRSTSVPHRGVGQGADGGRVPVGSRPRSDTASMGPATTTDPAGGPPGPGGGRIVPRPCHHRHRRPCRAGTGRPGGRRARPGGRRPRPG